MQQVEVLRMPLKRRVSVQEIRRMQEAQIERKNRLLEANQKMETMAREGKTLEEIKEALTGYINKRGVPFQIKHIRGCLSAKGIPIASKSEKSKAPEKPQEVYQSKRTLMPDVDDGKSIVQIAINNLGSRIKEVGKSYMMNFNGTWRPVHLNEIMLEANKERLRYGRAPLGKNPKWMVNV